MGTKNNPGKFDCYAKAEPDEPMFVLLARDRIAPTLVRIWAAIRSGADNTEMNTLMTELYDKSEQCMKYPERNQEKLCEAYDCAISMDKYRAAAKDNG